MESYYLLVIFLAFLPIIYQYTFWLYNIQNKEYRWDKLQCYLKSPQYKKAFFNFWFFIEIPIFFCTLLIFINTHTEIIIYPLTITFLILYNIFIIGKILRKKIFLPKITGRLFLTLVIGIIFIYTNIIFLRHIFYPYYTWIYSFIIVFLIISPFFIYICVFSSIPIVNIIKKRKILKAVNRSKQITHPIKIGITGSYGKSSVKEYISSILEKDGLTLKTPENQNTEISVSNLILKKLHNNYKYFVAEMGAYRIGEINTLGNIINHTHGFLTAIGTQHIGLFGGIENTKKAKMEIANKVIANNGILYINRENKEIRSVNFDKNLKIVKYGNYKGSNVIYTIIGIRNNNTKFCIEYKKKIYTFQTNIIGSHNILNLTGVIAFCLDIGIPVKIIQKASKNLQIPANTLEIIKRENYIIINDSYNLSENGVIAGIEVLSLYKGNKVLVMDDIYELGKHAKEIHIRLGEKIAKLGKVNQYYLIGKNYSQYFKQGLFHGGCRQENILHTFTSIQKGSIILLEGRNSKKYINIYL